MTQKLPSFEFNVKVGQEGEKIKLENFVYSTTKPIIHRSDSKLNSQSNDDCQTVPASQFQIHLSN